MAFRAGIQRISHGNLECMFGLRRLTHSLALPAPVGNAMEPFTSPSFSLPESGSDSSFQFPNFGFGSGSMELMAVPKKKISKHKRGIRNGPKALKPTPVIVRCKCCGRVKLPHFYCCSGRREETGEKS